MNPHFWMISSIFLWKKMLSSTCKVLETPKTYNESSPLSSSVSKRLLAIIESLLPVTLNKHIILTRTSNREGVCTATDPGLPLDPAQPHLTLSGVRIMVWQPHRKLTQMHTYIQIQQEPGNHTNILHFIKQQLICTTFLKNNKTKKKRFTV